MKYKAARLTAYLVAAVICYGTAVSVNNQAGLMAAVAVGLFVEICFWREIFLRWTRVPDSAELTHPRS